MRLHFSIRRFSLIYLPFRNVSLRSTGSLSVKRMDTLQNLREKEKRQYV